MGLLSVFVTLLPMDVSHGQKARLKIMPTAPSTLQDQERVPVSLGVVLIPRGVHPMPSWGAHPDLLGSSPIWPTLHTRGC